MFTDLQEPVCYRQDSLEKLLGGSMPVPLVRRLDRAKGEPVDFCSGDQASNSEGETSMRFMIIRKADKDTEAGVLPNKQLLAAMMNYNEEMVKAGVMLQGEGLQASSKGARIKFSGGKPQVIDGPFAETKELIAGFTMIQAKSKEEAIEWVKRWPALDANGEVELEIRQVFEAEDFGPELTPEIKEQEERLRAQTATKW